MKAASSEQSAPACFTGPVYSMVVMYSAFPPCQYNGNNIFCCICVGKNSMGGGSILLSIVSFSLFYFFRNNQHPEMWSVSFKNFFRKCECIKKSLRKTCFFSFYLQVYFSIYYFWLPHRLNGLIILWFYCNNINEKVGEVDTS